VTSDERVRTFKEVARDYPKYLEHIQGIDDKLEVLRAKMEGVHSINLEKEPAPPSFSERPLVEMIERKALLEKEKQYYQDLIDWVHHVIDCFGSPAIKALVWMTYVQRRSLSSISDELLISKDNLYKIRRKYLNRVLTDEVMARLDEIRSDSVIENAM
jgi:hypothetical protein